MSTVRHLRYKDLGQWVPGHCVYCRGPLPADCNKSRRWCSAECVHQYRLRAQSGYLRDHVHQRDHGICALCGFDTDFFSRVIGRLRERSYQECLELWREASDQACREVWPVENEYVAARKHLDGHRHEGRPGTPEAWALYQKRANEISKANGYATRDKNTDVNQYCAEVGVLDTIHNLWQADHVTPVCEGGGASRQEDPMANIRTLCTACHKGETKALAGRRARKKKPTS